ncbi:MAG: hypothetical protein COT89_02380 [Candidatus Colwellbacteria bacterium CG10_big_fil_rev_8_21_14_0_10_42_22]|uniref:Septum formation initiator n=1 Tax=Candidatus Colwellbacteria bacterium CG10_big_fil_rev_8_21_14_0_10_42_22 TaxID=1974540 RepID=A0A2H0VFN0_9BACT|nr:MAG: hypothetical protein COT89_02380 [Candidatus Colwellbacteria bacterium CG10_big_fil_rev_8_21_14_0_10_42_22]
MKKWLVTIIVLMMMTLLGSQVYELQKKRIDISKEYGEINASYQEVEEDSSRLSEKIEYLSEPRNLEKELRSKFNYKYPNETLIIVVPKDTEGESGTGE